MNQNLITLSAQLVETRPQIRLLRITLAIWNMEFAIGVCLSRKLKWKKWIWGHLSWRQSEFRIWPVSVGWRETL